MNSLGLSPASLEARRKYICAGDAAALMAGQANQVWKIKRGLIEPPPFYDTLDWFIQKNVSREEMELRCQLGLLTEPYNLAYCQERTGRTVHYYSSNEMMRDLWRYLTAGQAATPDELQTSKTYPFMACHLDGMTTTAKGHPCVIDAKWTARVDDAMIMRYTAAGVHQATVMGTDWWALSAFSGNGKWELIEQEVDPIYQAGLVAREREFWGYVERGEEPVDEAEAVAPPKPQPKLRNIAVPIAEDEVYAALCKQNNWLPDASRMIRDFVGTHAAATKHNIVREELKKLVPEDVGELSRGLFKFKRSKVGAVTMSLAKGENDAS